jgi:hypothetical protein
MFTLRFDKSEIHYWAGRYKVSDDVKVEAAARRNKKRGYLTKNEFMELCRWKTPRAKQKCEHNPENLIHEATGIALSAYREEIRIGALMILDGVSWPTASVILHFWHNEPYPILDFRALWSVGVDEPPNYTFDFWWRYAEFCRELAKESNANMRIVDQSLWQFSSENQRAATIGTHI